jgi:hypothetical protein
MTMTTTSDLPARQAAVRDAILGALPDEPSVSSTQLSEIRSQLNERLRPLVAGRAPDSVHIDRYRLPDALDCPASSEREGFEWAAPLAARSLAVPALRMMVRSGEVDPLGFVRRAIAEAVEENKSLGEWLATLDDPEMAATVSAALSWASRAWVAVPWRALDKPRFGLESIWVRPLGFDTPVVLRGRPDATIFVRGARAEQRVLVTVGWPDPVVSRFDALVVALYTRRAPLRTVAVHPASGRIVAMDVECSMLHAAVDDVVTATAGLAPAAIGRPLEEVPGRHCWHCGRRPNCPTGTSWVATQERRVGGIPVSA